MLARVGSKSWLLRRLALNVSDSIKIGLELLTQLLASVSLIVYPSILLSNSVLQPSDLILGVRVGSWRIARC